MRTRPAAEVSAILSRFLVLKSFVATPMAAYFQIRAKIKQYFFSIFKLNIIARLSIRLSHS